jgi:type 1 fimbria pilin
MFKLTRLMLGVLFVLVCSLAVLAQGGTGQLSGTVVDANEAVVPGATVKLTSLATSQVR